MNGLLVHNLLCEPKNHNVPWFNIMSQNEKNESILTFDMHYHICAYNYHCPHTHKPNNTNHLGKWCLNSKFHIKKLLVIKKYDSPTNNMNRSQNMKWNTHVYLTCGLFSLKQYQIFLPFHHLSSILHSCISLITLIS